MEDVLLFFPNRTAIVCFEIRFYLLGCGFSGVYDVCIQFISQSRIQYAVTVEEWFRALFSTENSRDSATSHFEISFSASYFILRPPNCSNLAIISV
jgi:hypothetical protein